MRSALLALVSILALPAQAQTTAAGATPGSFRVAESGAAEYRIPIRVPPGIAGMEPKLALTYNSQAGNGLLGVGWNLEGLSAITRCPRTMAQDGVRGAVNYTLNDRFCLDGQRLIAISGSYSADGTEYRTERESFSKVVSYGAAGSGPAWFKVWTKSGQVMEYGNTADSRIEVQGLNTVRVWAVNKVSDTKGNHLTVAYVEDGANGDYRPDRIDYGASSVRFTYQDRSDVTPAYVAGSVVKTLKRLAEVDAYRDSASVRKYVLTYDPTGGAMGRSRLLNVRECAADGACLSPTSIVWQSGASLLAGATGGELTSGGYGSSTTYSRLTDDFNGDGKSDLIALYTGPSGVYAYTALGLGDGSFGPVQGGQLHSGGFGADPYDGAYSRLTGDLNGDGLADIIVMYTGESGIWAYTALGKGDGSFWPMQGGQVTSGGYGSYSTYSRLVADLNGDGRSDLVALHTGPSGVYAYTALGLGDGSFGPVQGGQLHPGGFGEDGAYSRLTGDLNGDGLADVIVMYTGTSGIWAYTALGKGDGSFWPMQGGQLTSGGYGSYSTYSRLIADLNHDGRSDLVALHAGPSGVYAYTALGLGDGSFGPVQGGQLHPGGFGEDGAYSRLTGDLNGDGLPDIIVMYTGTSGVWAYTALGKGDGTFLPAQGGQLHGGGFGSYDTYSRLVVDLNGDGKSDLLAMYTGTAGIYAYSSRNDPTFPDLALAISNGLGASVSMAYKPLTDASVYTKDSGAVYPRKDVQGPMYVVSSESSSNGIGGTQSNAYRYAGLRFDQDGRGLLGFTWLEATQQATGLKTRTDFFHAWPYVGMPAQVRRWQTPGALLSQTANSYSCINPATGTACTVAVGNRYFGFVAQSVDTGNDLNGAALPTVTTTTQYDVFGNPTNITVSTGDGHSKTTTNTFVNNAVSWLLGRLTRSTVQSTSP